MGKEMSVYVQYQWWIQQRCGYDGNGGGGITKMMDTEEAEIMATDAMQREGGWSILALPTKDQVQSIR